MILNRHASLDHTPLNPDVKTTESYVDENANLDAAARVKRGEPHTLAACCHCHA